MKTLTDHVPNALLMTMVSVVLLSGCDYPVVPLTPHAHSRTTRLFKLEALIPTDDTEPGNFAEFTIGQVGRHLGLFSVEACCNLTRKVTLEMYHLETGDTDRSDIKGSLTISTDQDNFLYGAYIGSGERKDGLCDIYCHVTTKNCKGIFITEETCLNLCISGIFERGNLHPVAYQIVVDGHLLPPQPN